MDSADLQEAWEERLAIMVYDGQLSDCEAAEMVRAARVPPSATP